VARGDDTTVAIRLQLKDRLKFSREAKAAEDDLDRIGDKADQAGQSAEKGSGGWGKFSKAAGLAAAAGVVAAGKLAHTAVNAAMDFDKGMREVYTLLPGISGEAMAEMESQVQSFARATGVLPEESMPALYQALSAGVPQDNVFEFLETANQAAVGGVTDLTTAVDGITSVVNAYGDDVIDAAKASDLMFTAVRLGKTDFGQLSGSLYNVIPTAAAAGVAFEDVAAGVAALTAQGTPTSVATTQMRQMFVELSKKGTATDKVFRKIAGQSFKEFVKGGGNVQEALQLLERHADKSNLGINDLFGSVEAGGAALALTGQGTEAFGDALDEMGNASGATAAAYDTMNTGLGKSIERLRAMKEMAILSLGKALTPHVEKAADYLENNLVPALKAGHAWFKRNSTVIGVVAAVIGGAVAGLLAYKAVVLAIRLPTMAWAKAQAALNLIMSANPIGLVVVAIAALAAGFVYAYRRSETFRNVVNAVWSGLKSGATTAVNWVIGMINKLIGAFNAAIRLANRLPGVSIPEIGTIPEVSGASASSAAHVSGVPTGVQRYAGGPARRGQPLLVGEFGPELFVPSVPGVIKDRATTASGDGSPTLVAQLQVNLDGREIARTTSRVTDLDAARRG
jgi:TP901 family phage tail tape measure protein